MTFASRAALAAMLVLCFLCPLHAQTGVLHELWEGVPGDAISELTTSPKYQQPPDQVRIMQSFQA